MVNIATPRWGSRMRALGYLPRDGLPGQPRQSRRRAGQAERQPYTKSICAASPVVLTRVLADHSELHTPTGHLSIGWLVMEELIHLRNVLSYVEPEIVCPGGSSAV